MSESRRVERSKLRDQRAEARTGREIRRRRGVAAAHIGRGILFDGQAGVIIGFDGPRDQIIASVRVPNSSARVVMHLDPVWGVTYLPDEPRGGW